MADETPEYNQVWMGTLATADNAGYLPIIGTVSTLSTGTFPPKTTIGDYTKDADDFISTWIISDLSGGMNVEDMNEGSDTARAWTIFADTRKPGKIALNPLVKRYNWTSSTGTSYPLGVVNDTVYAVIGSEICAWSEANEDFGTTYADEAITLTPAGKPVAFAGRIFVPCGTSGYFYVTESATGNPTVTDVTTGVLTYPAAYDPDVPDVNPPKPAAFWVFDQKLWALTTGGALAWSFTGNDDDWTWPYNEAEGWYPRIESGATPQRIIGFYNPNGDPTLFIITDRGAYRFEWGALKIVDTPVQFPPHPDFGGAVCVWRAGEDLHIGGGLDTVRYTSANVVVPLSGLARDDGVPQELRGKIYDLEPETSEMYALLGPTDGGQSLAYSSQFITDGTGNTNASSPKQIALDDSGDIYIADFDNDRLKRHSSDGTFEANVVTSLDEVTGIAVESGASPDFYVSYKAGSSDYRVRKYNAAGTVQWTSGAAAANQIWHLATDESYVYGTFPASGTIVKINATTGAIDSVLGASGSGDGQFTTPHGIAYSSTTGNLYVVDQGNDRVQEITTAGVFVRKWGSSGSGEGQFTTPTGIAIHPTGGTVYVADSGRDDGQIFTPTGGFVQTFGSAGTGNGQFTAVDGIAVNSSSSVWVSDRQSSSACRIQKFALTTATLAAYPWLAAWTGIGWYGKWKGSTTGVQPTWAIVTATTTAYRLWWGSEDGYLYTCKLKRFFHNPRQALIAGDDEFEDEGEIITPRFDAAMLGNWKLASHMVVFMENATSDETITIEYRTDADDGWTLLGEVDSTDKTYLPFAVDATTEFSAGVPFNWIQFRIKLFRGSDTTQTPIIQSLVFCYIPIPQNARAFQFTVAFPSDEWLGRDGNEIRQDLFDLVTSREMLRLKPWPNENDQEFRGYLTATNGDDTPDRLVRGSRAVNFIEIRDADYD
jgi:DNA-binding beta-propeller fold protein YncE